MKKMCLILFEVCWVFSLFLFPTTSSSVEPEKVVADSKKKRIVDSEPHFSDYAVPIYTGRQTSPKGIKQVGPNEWRDMYGKLVEPPEINFSGKYSITLHSCGTECRYYQMTDMSNGKDIPALGMFSTMENRHKTKSGRTYFTELLYVAASKLLVAQYHIDFDNNSDRMECREKTYVFEEGRLKPNSKTKIGCTKFKEFE